jgi:hypothetical protein
MISLLAIAWYLVEFVVADPVRMPGGSSRVGLCLGLAAGACFVFEFLYWPRRFPRIRAWRIGRTETWLRAHIWLGLLTLPLVVLHSGFTTGGWFTTLFCLLFLVVYFSGVFGLIMQQVIPSKLLDELPEETIYSQIDSVIKQHLDDAERLVAETTDDSSVYSQAETTYAEDVLLVGSSRRTGTIHPKVLNPALHVEAIPYTEALCTALENDIRPFLLGPANRESVLGTPGRAGEYFAELRRRVPAAAHGVVERLESICMKHRQLRRQRRLYFWLHAWLSVHLPCSVALIIFLLLHIFTSLQFSGIPFLAH